MAIAKTEQAPSAHDLIHAAMVACDHWNDGQAAREQMRMDCMTVAAHQRADLISHFRETYP